MVRTPELSFDSSLNHQQRIENGTEIFFGQRKNGTYYKEIVFDIGDFYFDDVKSYGKEMFGLIINNISIHPK